MKSKVQEAVCLEQVKLIKRKATCELQNDSKKKKYFTNNPFPKSENSFDLTMLNTTQTTWHQYTKIRHN